MPIHETDTQDRKALEKKRKENVCAVCGEWLAIWLDNDGAYLACHRHNINHHEGIMKPASKYQTQGISGMTIEARRNIMNQEYGESKTSALARYQGVTSLSKQDAMVILETIWPGAPSEEKTRAALLCASYHLNPLMKHVYLIKFNKWNKAHDKIIGEDWATVMGIGATRLLASRQGSFSYVDDTPRIMTEAEQKRTFGQSYPERLYVLVKLKDPKTGAEAPGYGWWPTKDKAYGEEKGNTIFNMAAIRAERQALNRLRPGEMPTDVEVMDENYLEPPKGDFVEGEGRIIEEEKPESAPQKPPETEEASPENTEQSERQEASVINTINLSDLNDQLAELKKKAPKTWGDANLVAYMKKSYGLAEGTDPLEMAKRLDQPKATHFMVKVQEALEMA